MFNSRNKFHKSGKQAIHSRGVALPAKLKVLPGKGRTIGAFRNYFRQRHNFLLTAGICLSLAFGAIGCAP